MSEETEQLEARIAAYIDGELPEADAARLEVFLANTDPKLAEQVLGMMTDKNRLRTLPRERAPADLAPRIMEQVERATLLQDVDHLSLHKRGWWQSRVSIAAAVAILVGGFGFLVVQSVIRPPNAVNLPELAKASSPADEKSAVANADRALAMEPRAVASAAPSGRPADGSLAGGGGLKIGKGGDLLAKLDNDKHKEGFDTSPVAEIKREEVVQSTLNTNQFLVQNGGAPPANYASADSATKALSRMALSGSISAQDPIVVTLVARDNDDALRLQNAIQDFMRDPNLARRQTSLQRRLRDINTYASNYNVNWDNGNIQLNQAIGNSTNPGAQNTSSTIANSGNIANTGNIGGNAIALNNDGYQVYNGKTFEQVYANERAKAQQAKLNLQPGPLYRVVLKEEQLQQITSSFDVYSLSCGGSSYVISEKSRMAKSAAPGGEIAGGGRGEQPSPPSSSKVAAHTPDVPAPAAMPATSPSKSAGTEYAAESIAKDAQGWQRELEGNRQTTQAAAQQQVAEQQRMDNQRLLECVIKMELRPTQSQFGTQREAQSPLLNQQAK